MSEPEIDDIRMRLLRRAAHDLEAIKLTDDAEAVRKAQLRFDRLHLRVFRNLQHPVDLRNAQAIK